MSKLVFIILLFPFVARAHPGVGIVKDSKGIIYYTDLHQVWKIANGNKIIAVPDVHTHELYLDANDNLYGEGGYYDENTNKFYHYLWVYHPGGQVDTAVSMREQYVRQDFALARDREGNQYYLMRFVAPHTDTNHIYRKTPGGGETVFATGNFAHVNWLHPQEDGSILYTSDNTIYKLDRSGNIRLVKQGIANTRPLSRYSRDLLIWGIWEDKEQNIYAAVFSDQRIRKIDATGNMKEVYKSTGNWMPLHGVFDNDGNLWVLETNEKNDIRVTKAGSAVPQRSRINSKFLTYIISASLLAGALIFYFKFRKFSKQETRNGKQ